MGKDLSENSELKKFVNSQRNLVILFVLLTVVLCLTYVVMQIYELPSMALAAMCVIYCMLAVYVTGKYLVNTSNLSKCYTKTSTEDREGISANELSGVMVVDLAIIFLMVDTLINLFRKVLGEHDKIITAIEYICAVIAVSIILIVFRGIVQFSFRRINSN